MRARNHRKLSNGKATHGAEKAGWIRIAAAAAAAAWLMAAAETATAVQAPASGLDVIGNKVNMRIPGSFGTTPTGGATYTIPIEIPVPAAGFGPSIALTYSSQSGDGLVGLGWSISGLSAITRCPRTVAQDGVHGSVNYDSNDRFCLDGQRLIAINGTYGADSTEYRTELDTFSKIVSYGTTGSGPTWFKVLTKSGVEMQYGGDNDARAMTVGLGTASARVWAVHTIIDKKNNRWDVDYNNQTQDLTNGEIYPTRIYYSLNFPASKPNYYIIYFDYETRPDPSVQYFAGSYLKNTKRLTNIKTGPNPYGQIRDYQLTYMSGADTLQRSRLKEITYCNYGDCIPKSEFTWIGDAATPNYTPSGYSSVPGGLNLAGDWNGDGLLDIMTEPNAGNCVLSGTTCEGELYIGTGSGFASQTITLDPNFFSIDEYPVGGQRFLDSISYAVNDANGDGLADLVVYVAYTDENPLPQPPDEEFASFLLLNDGSYTFTLETGLPFTGFGGVPGDIDGDGLTDHANPIAGDFNGDGCTDMLTNTSTNHKISYSDSCSPTTDPDLPGTWSTTWQNFTLIIGDYNGDGLTDVLTAKSNANGKLWLSTGRGLVDQSFTVPTGWQTGVAGDWNADGRTDIAVGSNIYYSRGTRLGGGTGTPSVDVNMSGGVIRALDYNNDGATDVYKSGEPVYANIPEVIQKFKDGLGAETTVTYERLNADEEFYVIDTDAVHPDQDIGGPMFAVKQASRSDGIGSTYDVTYQYRGARQNFYGRGFLGVRQRIVTDSETGIVTTENYARDFPFTGLLASRTQVKSGVTLTSLTNTYCIYDPIDPSDIGDCVETSSGDKTWFVFLKQSEQENRDLNDAERPMVTTTYGTGSSNGYDEYGHVEKVSVLTALGSNSIEKITTNTYESEDLDDWIIGRVATTSTQAKLTVSSSLVSDITRSAEFDYETTGSGTGHSGYVTDEILEPGASSDIKQHTHYTYDDFGNKLTIVTGYHLSGASQRTTTFAYNADGMPTGVTNAEGEEETFTLGSDGQLTSRTDANGITTSWSFHGNYDGGYENRYRENRPDGTRVDGMYYKISSPPTAVFKIETGPYDSTDTVNGPYQVVYYDILGRQTLHQSWDAYAWNWRYVSTEFNATGQVYRTSRPYYDGETKAWTTNSYDALGRITETTAANGLVTQTAYAVDSNAMKTKVTRKKDATEANDQITYTIVNVMGLPEQVIDANNKTTSYEYDAFGNVTKITGPSGAVTRHAYDVRGRRTFACEPDKIASIPSNCASGSSSQKWSYAYNSFSELTTQTDAKGQKAVFTYDKAGRKTVEDVRNASDVTKHYSTWTYGTSASSHNIGKLVDATAQAEQKSFLTSGTTWSVPGDWNNSANTIEVIGAGGNGAAGTGTNVGGGGGGGGGYSKVVNASLTAGSSVNIQIGTGGSGNATWVKNNSSTIIVQANAGGNASGASGGAGGTAAVGTGSTGGAGGTESSSGAGAGGGGAAGPSGVGRAGGNANGSSGSQFGGSGGGGANGGSSTGGEDDTSTSTGGDGGHGNGGTGGGAGGASNNSGTAGASGKGAGGGGTGRSTSTTTKTGGAGSIDTAFDSMRGAGGGGGGGGNATTSNRGGNGGGGGTYGGGGGGGGASPSGTDGSGGTGGQGLVVITYTDTTTRSFTYDSIGRPSSMTLNAKGVSGTYTTTYNIGGYTDTVAYPSGFVAKYVYGYTRFVSYLKDNASGADLWIVSNRNRDFLPATETAGATAFQQWTAYDEASGLVETIQAGPSYGVANFSYGWDKLGNLTSRTNALATPNAESFCYDKLNRLTHYDDDTGCTGGTELDYDSGGAGNITRKSDVCNSSNCYSYPSASAARPHAVSQISSAYGFSNPKFLYDSVGNLTCIHTNSSCTGGDVKRQFTYTAFNMADLVVDASTTKFDYDYGPARERVRMVDTTGTTTTTTYFNDAISGLFSEKVVVSGGSTTWKDYLSVDGRLVGMRSKVDAGAPSFTYFVRDHLGSVAVTTDSSGGTICRLQFDPWGKRFGSFGCAGTKRGFTGHEMIDNNFHLVNMNARIFDATIARFIAADPVGEAPVSQGLNSFSYVANNPLSFTDPTGLAACPDNPGMECVGTAPFPSGDFKWNGGPPSIIPISWTPIGAYPGSNPIASPARTAANQATNPAATGEAGRTQNGTPGNGTVPSVPCSGLFAYRCWNGGDLNGDGYEDIGGRQAPVIAEETRPPEYLGSAYDFTSKQGAAIDLARLVHGRPDRHAVEFSAFIYQYAAEIDGVWELRYGYDFYRGYPLSTGVLNGLWPNNTVGWFHSHHTVTGTAARFYNNENLGISTCLPSKSCDVTSARRIMSDLGRSMTVYLFNNENVLKSYPNLPRGVNTPGTVNWR